MIDPQTFPSDKAWNYFLKHKDNIRDIVVTYLAVPQWQSMAGPFGNKSEFDIAAFDKAVEAKDASALNSIMNDAWGRAPEDRAVYSIPGFSEMCNLLDGTVEDFIDPGYEELAP